MRYRALGLGLAALVLSACEPANGEDEASAAKSVAPDRTASSAKASTPAEMTCAHPVRAGDTAASVLERFGDQARAETLYGSEGIELAGVVLWPDDPARRAEVVFGEEGPRTVSLIRLSAPSEWRIAGLAAGDPLASVRAANGGPFELWGFSWDYGGYVTDLKDGKLAAIPGGCRVMMRLGVPEEIDLASELQGEVEMSSDDPRLKPAGVRIDELSLGFPYE